MGVRVNSQSFNLGLRRDFPWQFVVADVQLPIIGVDLLSHYGLTPRPLKEQQSARHIHIILNARPHRANFSRQCEDRRQRRTSR